MTSIISTDRLMRFISSVLVLALLCQPTAMPLLAQAPGSGPGAVSSTIATVAGGGLATNIPAPQAPLVAPTGVILDPKGRGFYVLDGGVTLGDVPPYGFIVRFVNTTSQAVTLGTERIEPNCLGRVAGGGSSDGDDIPAVFMNLDTATGMAVDPTGDLIYLLAPNRQSIRAVNVGSQAATVLNKTIAPGAITTVFSGDNAANGRGLAVHPTTREIYYAGASSGSNIVYRIGSTGQEIPVAGGSTQGDVNVGPATQAKLVNVTGLTFDRSGSLYISEGGTARTSPGRIRRVDSAETIFTPASGLAYPLGVTVAPDGNLYVAQGNAQNILRIGTNGQMTVVAGSQNVTICDMNSSGNCGDGGPAGNAGFNIPGSTDGFGLTLGVDAAGIYVPDFRNKRVRYINNTNSPVTIAGAGVGAGQINTIVGSGLKEPYDDSPATAAEVYLPTGVAADANGNLFITERSGSNRLRFVNRGQQPVTLFAGLGWQRTVQTGQIVTLNDQAGGDRIDDSVTTTALSRPQCITYNGKGLLIADSESGVRYPSPTSGQRAGGILFLNLSNADVTFFPNGAGAVVVPPGMVRRIAGLPAGNKPPSSIGDGGQAADAIFFPRDVDQDNQGNIYIADKWNQRIRRIDAGTGIISSVTGSFSEGSGPTPIVTGYAVGIGFDRLGRLHIADTMNLRVVRQNEAGGTSYSVIAQGRATSGGFEGIGYPLDLTVDAAGRVFVMSGGTQQILQVTAPTNGIGQVFVAAGKQNPYT